MAIEDLSAFEFKAIEVKAQNDRDRDILLAQLALAKVAARDHTGVGLYVDIAAPESAPRMDRERRTIEDMPKGHARHPLLTSGAGIILWIKDGLISCHECYTYEGDWPCDESLFSVTSG